MNQYNMLVRALQSGAKATLYHMCKRLNLPQPNDKDVTVEDLVCFVNKHGAEKIGAACTDINTRMDRKVHDVLEQLPRLLELEAEDRAEQVLRGIFEGRAIKRLTIYELWALRLGGSPPDLKACRLTQYIKDGVSTHLCGYCDEDYDVTSNTTQHKSDADACDRCGRKNRRT
jgi:hypothetical protein